MATLLKDGGCAHDNCCSTTTASKLSRAEVLLLPFLDLFRLGLCSQLVRPLLQRLLVFLAVTVEAVHHLVLELPLDVVSRSPSQASLSSKEFPRLLFLVQEALRLLSDRVRAPRGLGARKLRPGEGEPPLARKGLSVAAGATWCSAAGSSRRPGGWVHTSDTSLSDWAANSAVSAAARLTCCATFVALSLSLSSFHAPRPQVLRARYSPGLERRRSQLAPTRQCR